MNPAVKLQYADNIRWIREAAKHELVRAWPGEGRAGHWAACLSGRWEPQEGANTLHETSWVAGPRAAAATSARGLLDREAQGLSKGGLEVRPDGSIG